MSHDLNFKSPMIPSPPRGRWTQHKDKLGNTLHVGDKVMITHVNGSVGEWTVVEHKNAFWLSVPSGLNRRERRASGEGKFYFLTIETAACSGVLVEEAAK